ncbi:hypothetical protein HKCCSP123_02675 [Rhodobacterales bacterium HKCCSP123]|nr:hypothetical protein [Rhodobacterales bacterium HKCCSP123]
MSPFRLVIVAGCLLLMSGAGYMSWYGVARESRDLSAAAPSARIGSATSGTGGGYGFFGRVK